MIPHNMTLFKFMCIQYQFHGQTLPIMKIDRGQIQFREYVSTGTEPSFRPSFLGHKLKPHCIVYFKDSKKGGHMSVLGWAC